MKKSLLVLSFAAAAMFGSLTAGTPIDQNQLPKEVKSFITKYFPGEKIRKAEKDNGYRGVEYDVDLSSGAEMEFREDGTWKEVKASHGSAVPAAIIPAAISKYVKAQYPAQSIIEISRKRGGYEIELSNGVELKLTEDAKPLANQGGGHRGGGKRK